MIRKKQLLTATLALGLSTGLASGQNFVTADVLAQWTFASDLSPTTVATGASASAFGNSATLTAGPFSSGPGPHVDGSSYVGGQPFLSGGAADLPNNQDGRTFGRPFNNLDTAYHHFSITANDQSFALGSIGFDVGWRSGGGNEMRVQYSFSSDFSNPVTIAHMAGYTASADVDGLGVGPVDLDTGLPTIGVPSVSGSSSFSWNRYVFGINDTLAQGETVYFRIQGAGQTTGNANIHMDNITVAIPEPSTYAAIFGLLGLGLAFRLRRRRA
jgi:MYXO-CTERM domain-containing protein